MKNLSYYGMLAVLSVTIFTMGGCYYDNEMELYGATQCDTTNVTYSIFVEPLISDNCYVCHALSANLGGVTLEGHAAVSIYVNNGRLLGAIKHLADFSPMPQGAPKLSDCRIEKINAWINAGALNN